MRKKASAEVITPSCPNWRSDILVVGLPHIVLSAAHEVAAALGIDADYVVATPMPAHWGVLQSVWLPPSMGVVPEAKGVSATPFAQAPDLQPLRPASCVDGEAVDEVLCIGVQRWGPQHPLAGSADPVVARLRCDLPPSISNTAKPQTLVLNMGMWDAFEVLKTTGGDFDAWMKMWDQDAPKKKLATKMQSLIPAPALDSWIRRLTTNAHLQATLPAASTPKTPGRF